MCRKNQIQKIGAFMLAIVMICSIMISSFFIFSEAGHICAHNDCPICQSIRTALELFVPVGNAVFAGFVCAALFLFMTVVFVPIEKQGEHPTLVGLKVKLID